MEEIEKIKEILGARESAAPGARAGNWQEFIVLFSPAGKLRCKILDGGSGQPRPFLFGRGETDAFPDLLEASRIIATPEGNPTGVFAAAWPTDARARVRVFFFNEGAVSGDTFVYRKEDGTSLDLRLLAIVDGSPTQIYQTAVDDDQEHSTTIQIPTP